MPRRSILFSLFFSQQMVIFLKTINQIMFILCFKNPKISPLKPQESLKPLPGPVAHLVSKPLATSSCLISPASWTPAILAFSVLLKQPPSCQLFPLVLPPSLCTFFVWNPPPWIFVQLSPSYYSNLCFKFPPPWQRLF